MSSAATESPQPRADELLVKLNRRTKRMYVVVWILVPCFVLSLVGGFFLVRWKLAAIEKARKDLSFSLFVSDYNNAEDFVQPTVNTIQFLRHRYSITFDKVEYTPSKILL